MRINSHINRTRSTSFFFLMVIILAISGCDSKNKNRKIAIIKVTEEGSAKVSDTALVNLLRAQTKLDVDIQYNLSEDFVAFPKKGKATFSST